MISLSPCQFETLSSSHEKLLNGQINLIWMTSRIKVHISRLFSKSSRSFIFTLGRLCEEKRKYSKHSSNKNLNKTSGFLLTSYWQSSFCLCWIKYWLWLLLSYCLLGLQISPSCIINSWTVFIHFIFLWEISQCDWKFDQIKANPGFYFLLLWYIHASYCSCCTKSFRCNNDRNH